MKYKVTYISSEDGDATHAWTEADSPSEAAQNILFEQWDCDSIISITPLEK